MLLMEKYGLTPTELFVVKVLYLYKENYPEAYIIRYLNIPDNIISNHCFPKGIRILRLIFIS